MDAAPYLCPACRTNRTRFTLIYHFAQQVHKDPRTGALTFAADELAPLERAGRPALDVRCEICNFQGNEGVFVKAARKDGPPGQRPPS